MSTPFAGGKVDFNKIEPGFEPLNTDTPIRPAENRSFAPAATDFELQAEREFDREDRAFAAAPPTEEFRRETAQEEAFAPTPVFATAPRKLKHNGGINPAFIALPIVAVVGVGAALLLTSNRGPAEPELGASLPVETAQAPLANPTLPPVVPADTAIVPPAPIEVAEAPAARVAPARATPRVQRAAAPAAAAPAAADTMGVDASATLPAGPTTYGQLNRSAGDAAPVTPGSTAPAPVTTTATPVAPTEPSPVVTPEPAPAPETPASIEVPQ